MRHTTNIRQIGSGHASTVVNSCCRIPAVAPQHVVPRTRLLRQLEQIRDRRIVLIIAPPASGKTEFSRQWAEQCRLDEDHVAWVSLASAAVNVENLLRSFVRSLSIALDRPENLDGKQLNASQVRNELNVLINDIDEAGERLMLFLDGYDQIESHDIDKEIQQLEINLPASVTLVITTRRPLPWSLGKYRIADELTVLDFSQIRFDADESATFVAENAPTILDKEHVRELVESSDGWIAALKLTLLAIRPGQSRSRMASLISGRNKILEEFLDENIFIDLPTDAQELLVRCGALDRLNVSLCEHVMGSDTASNIIETLAHDYLFVEPSNLESSWYRLHKIQARFLRSKFERQPAEFRKSVHRRASEWYLENEIPREAIRHALAIDDYDAVRRILRRHGRHMVDDGDIKMLAVCKELLPDLDPEAEPLVALVFVWTCIIIQHYDEACTRLDTLRDLLDSKAEVRTRLSGIVQDLDEHLDVLDYRVRQALDPGWADYKVWEELRSAQQPDAHFKLQHIELALATAYLRRGRYNDAFTTYMSVRRSAEATNSRITSIAASIRMAQIRLTQGRMAESMDFCDKILIVTDDPASVEPPSPVSGVAYLIRAQIHFEKNDLDRCERDLERARSLVRQFGLAINIVPLDLLSAQLVAAKHGALAAATHLSGADKMPAHEGLSRPLEQVWASQAWYLLRAQDIETAESLLKRLDIPVDSKGPGPKFSCSVTEEYKYRVLCLYLIVTNRTISASAWLTKLMHQAEATGRSISRVSFGALLALCQARAGHKDRALRTIRQALVLGEQCECVRSMLDTGEEIVGLIREFASLRGDTGAQSERGPSDRYVGALLAAADGRDAISAATAVDQSGQAERSAGLHALLTPREFEILTCVCEGLSNRSISDDLMIGEGTVKWHTKNIYSKLGVSSRTQAAAKARNLNLVN